MHNGTHPKCCKPCDKLDKAALTAMTIMRCNENKGEASVTERGSHQCSETERKGRTPSASVVERQATGQKNVAQPPNAQSQCVGLVEGQMQHQNVTIGSKSFLCIVDRGALLNIITQSAATRIRMKHQQTDEHNRPHARLADPRQEDNGG